MVHIDADTVLVAIVAYAILFDPAGTEVGLPEKAGPGEKPAKLDELGSCQKILTLQSVDS